MQYHAVSQWETYSDQMEILYKFLARSTVKSPAVLLAHSWSIFAQTWRFSWHPFNSGISSEEKLAISLYRGMHKSKKSVEIWYYILGHLICDVAIFRIIYYICVFFKSIILPIWTVLNATERSNIGWGSTFNSWRSISPCVQNSSAINWLTYLDFCEIKKEANTNI